MKNLRYFIGLYKIMRSCNKEELTVWLKKCNYEIISENKCINRIQLLMQEYRILNKLINKRGII